VVSLNVCGRLNPAFTPSNIQTWYTTDDPAAVGQPSFATFLRTCSSGRTVLANDFHILPWPVPVTVWDTSLACNDIVPYSDSVCRAVTNWLVANVWTRAALFMGIPSGASLQGLYSHMHIYFPPLDCTGSAFAQLGGSLVFMMPADTNRMGMHTLLHETGHTLGLYHAGNSSRASWLQDQYADWSDTMGTGNQACFNTVNSAKLGWADRLAPPVDTKTLPTPGACILIAGLRFQFHPSSTGAEAYVRVTPTWALNATGLSHYLGIRRVADPLRLGPADFDAFSSQTAAFKSIAISHKAVPVGNDGDFRSDVDGVATLRGPPRRVDNSFTFRLLSYDEGTGKGVIQVCRV
jgi:hypothetical protein